MHYLISWVTVHHKETMLFEYCGWQFSNASLAYTLMKKRGVRDSTPGYRMADIHAILRILCSVLYVLQVNGVMPRHLLFTRMGAGEISSSLTVASPSIMDIDSALHCAQLCRLERGCESMSYNRVSRVCHIHADDNIQHPTNEDTTTRHYKITTRDPSKYDTQWLLS